jgi:hypothetical protein
MTTHPLLGRVSVVAALAVSIVLGCQLIGGIDDRTIATDTPDANNAGLFGDASADSPSADSSLLDAAVADAAAFCASQDASNVVFCDDFDQPDRTAMSQTGWAPTSEPVGEIVRDKVFSPPGAARFTYGGASGPSRAVNQITVPLNGPHTKLVFSSMVRVVTGTLMGGLELGLSPAGCTLEWDFPSSGLSSVCSEYADLGAPGTIPTDNWVPVTLAITNNPGRIHVQTTVGQGIQLTMHEGDIDADAGVLTVSVQIGNGGDDSVGTIYFDNFLVQTY